MAEESVKVAVRVRPFNAREKDRNSQLIINMQDKTTTIVNPANKSDVKKFAYDFSYWSHDGFKELPNGVLEAANSKYASQQIVFNDLGKGVLDNAFKGYNCSLFAYGQTGSGKSYSMVGYGPNKGIVPITCDELFKEIDRNKDPSKRFEVTLSMLEIYRENVRDLLSSEQPKGGSLQIRQHPTDGFYVPSLKKIPVASYKEIENWMTRGTNSRTIAATNMNATSSRAHTVVTINFIQVVKSPEGETQKSSTMNLVDLAGSERADSTGATGDRLKEGANINQSLSTLGNVISALAENSTSKKKVAIPYRNSVLTKLLQNALGGNSKTVMIAALSPADINYDETLSTLRYADRAKQIKTKAVVNESETDKLIRQLREENEKLRKALAEGKLPTGNTKGLSQAEIEKMRQDIEEELRHQLLANQEAMALSDKDEWDRRLKEAQLENQNYQTGDEKTTKAAKIPHLVNLNEDPQLSGVIIHFLESSKTTIGRPNNNNQPTIALTGLSISPNHAVIEGKKNKFEISPGTQGSKTVVNGMSLNGKVELSHNDRILFGSNHMYVFKNPLDSKCDPSLPEEIDWEFAQKEIAKAKGFQTGANLSKEQQIIQDQILEILPMVSEVNAISEELDKRKSFDVVLISGVAQEVVYGSQKSTKVMVKVKNLINENTWMWERGKFINRRYAIQELYQRYLDGEDVSNISPSDDPFYDPDEDVIIGTSSVFLQSLGYCLDFEDKLIITDYKGLEEGYLHVTLIPCNAQGKPLGDDAFVEDPNELMNKPYHFKVTIDRVEIFKSRFTHGIHAKYRVFKDKEFTSTPVIKDTLEPVFKHSKIVSFNKVTKEILQFFDTGFITFMIYGTQTNNPGNPSRAKLTTKELRDLDKMHPEAQGPKSIKQIRGPSDDGSGEVNRLKAELVTLQRKNERLVEKEHRLQKLCTEWAKKKETEKNFDPFFRAVHALANSTGTKFKTNAEIITKLLKLHKSTKSSDLSSNPSTNNVVLDSKACVVM